VLRNSKRWIVIILVLGALVAGYFGVRAYQDSQTEDVQWQTETVTKMDIQQRVSADGFLQSNQTARLAWQISGVIQAVDVELGDPVQSGQNLASLKQDSLPESVILAQIDLLDAQKALEDLLKGYSDLDEAQASQAVAEAKKAVEQAQEKVDNLTTPASDTQIANAYASMVLAKYQWDQMLQNIDRIQKKIDKNPDNYAFWETRKLYQDILQSLQLQEIQLRKNYLDAQQKYNQVSEGADPTDLSIAQANLAVAQSQLKDAQDQLQTIRSGPSEDDLQAAQARVEAAQNEVDKARLEAPIAGTVTDVSVQAGDRVSAGTQAFRIDDLSRILAVVDVSEIDVNLIRKDEPVTLTLDAAPDKNYQGRVLETPEVGEAQQGVASFSVIIEVTGPREGMLPGMTVGASILVNEVSGALAIPNEAIRFSNGERVVYILQPDGSLKPVAIQVGVSSITHSQVIDGDLKAGDQVVLNPMDGQS
jgi:HlyD family secretion protein